MDDVINDVFVILSVVKIPSIFEGPSFNNKSTPLEKIP